MSKDNTYTPQEAVAETRQPETGKAEPTSPVYVQDVVGNSHTKGEGVDNWEKIELPVRRACQILMGKNIATYNSSANRGDVQNGYAFIGFATHKPLTPANQIVADTLIAEGKAMMMEDNHGLNAFNLIVPLTPESKVDDVSAQFCELANRFEDQPRTMGAHTYSLREMRKIAFMNPDDETITPEVLQSNGAADPSMFDYDSETQMFIMKRDRLNQE